MAEQVPQNWHPETVKYAIRKSGIPVRDVAIGAGLDPSALSHCLHRPMPNANRAIAEFLGTTVHDIWPEWFDADGEPKPIESKPITRSGSDHGQKRAAV